jgi:hypothetical protein
MINVALRADDGDTVSIAFRTHVASGDDIRGTETGWKMVRSAISPDLAGEYVWGGRAKNEPMMRISTLPFGGGGVCYTGWLRRTP